MKIGDVVADRFVIERLTAAGGMGVVWRAIDRHTDGLAAVKVVATRDAQGVERFVREARTLAELRHPGIVRYLAHGRSDEGELFLAMEWLDGEDLSSRLATSELTVGESVIVATRIAGALAVTHARHIVHRDIKPSNVFLCDWQTERAKLLDFGVARIIRMQSVTATGYVVGTPVYMAPEQARGAKDLDARADVFGLGAMLFRCLTGRPPFAGSSAQAVIFQVLNEEVPRVRELSPEVPPDLDDLVARMLSKDPDLRPNDGAAVLSELIGFDATEPGARSRPARSELTGDERRIQCMLALDGEVSDAQRAIAAAYNCRLDASPGGAMGVLSGLRVATDQVQQAARCALALRSAAPGARVALVTGRAAGASGNAATDDAMVERIRRLIAAPAATDPAPVRIDEATAGLLGARFEVAGDANGLALAGERDVDEAARTLLGRRTAFVGRDRELEQLVDVFRDAEENAAARVILITAPAGMGKSRLRQELTRRLRESSAKDGAVRIWTGYGDPMRAGAPFGLLGQVVRRAAGVMGGEPIWRRQQLLEALVERAGQPRRVAEFLGELCGVPFPAEESPPLRAARRDPLLLAEQMRLAFEEWLGAECSAGPVVLVLEDLHWGDVPTVKFVDHALQALAERPLVVLGVARPEVHELFPRLWSERGLQELHIAALSRRASERLIREALGDGVGRETMADMVVRAQGNAFYLEELVRSVAIGQREALPETVLAMVAARFEAMDAEARRALRAASVFGEVFWSRGVEALLGGSGTQPIADRLGELVDREIIARRPAPRFRDEQEYGFRHSLLREAAYVMLTDEDRALGHRLAGVWLERAGEPEAVVLADHFERGKEPDRAAIWYRRAAEQALAGSDPEAAVARAERGVACGAGAELLGALRLVQAQAHRLRGDNAAAETSSREAMSSLEPGGDAWFVAVGEAAAACGKLFHVEALHALGEALEGVSSVAAEISAKQACALARASTQCFLCAETQLADTLLGRVHPLPPRLESEPEVVAHVETALGYRAWVAARYGDASVHLRRAVAAFEAAGDERSAVGELAVAAFGDVWLGRLEEARAVLEPLIERAERLGATSAASLARAYASLAACWMGDAERAIELARPAVARSAGSTQARILCFARISLALAEEMRGALDAAEEQLGAASAMDESALPPLLLAWGCFASFLVRRGRPAEGLEYTDRAVASVTAGRGIADYSMVIALARAEALAALGDPAADAALDDAIEWTRRALGRIADPLTREKLLRRVPVYARVAEMAQARGIAIP